jgi:hypothetical protein
MLLVVPHATQDWMDSLEPFTHPIRRPDSSVRQSIVTATQHTDVSHANAFVTLEQTALSQNVKGAMFEASSRMNWHPDGVLRPVARLAAVDGAVVLTASLDVLGFGAMISAGAVPDVYLESSSPDLAVRIRIVPRALECASWGRRFAQKRRMVDVMGHMGREVDLGCVSMAP